MQEKDKSTKNVCAGIWLRTVGLFCASGRALRGFVRNKMGEADRHLFPDPLNRATWSSDGAKPTFCKAFSTQLFAKLPGKPPP